MNILLCAPLHVREVYTCVTQLCIRSIVQRLKTVTKEIKIKVCNTNFL